MLITAEMIDEAERKDACEPAIEWLRARPRTVAELCECTEWALWAVGNGFAHLATPEQIDEWAEQRPDVALMYVAAQLTPERLDWCAKEWPGGALGFAAEYLTPERRAWCQVNARFRGVEARRGEF